MDSLDTKKWVSISQRDLDVAEYNLKGEKFEAAAFYSQQSAEKSLKAVYIKKFDALIKVHDLVLLARKVEASEELISLCKTLTSYYVETRYPGLSDDVLESEAAEAVNIAKKVLSWSKQNL